MKYDELRAIVRDLADCDTTDSAVGTCVLCWRVGKHRPECPYQRAREAIDEQHGPHPACRECGMGGDVGGTEPNPIPF